MPGPHSHYDSQSGGASIAGKHLGMGSRRQGSAQKFTPFRTTSDPSPSRNSPAASAFQLTPSKATKEPKSTATSPPQFPTVNAALALERAFDDRATAVSKILSEITARGLYRERHLSRILLDKEPLPRDNRPPLLPKPLERKEPPAAENKLKLRKLERKARQLVKEILEIGPSAIPVAMETVRGLVKFALESNKEGTILQELEAKNVPQWKERHCLPLEAQTDDVEEWMRRYFSDYLTHFDAPADRLFQFQLGRFDPGLLGILKTMANRGQLSVNDLGQMIGTKSDYLESIKELLFSTPLWEVFKRLWAAEQRKAARRRAASR